MVWFGHYTGLLHVYKLEIYGSILFVYTGDRIEMISKGVGGGVAALMDYHDKIRKACANHV